MDIFIDKYRVISPLGKGGFGSVVLAEDTHLKTQVAIKQMKRNDSSHNEFLALKKLKNKGLPGIIDFLEKEEEYYLVMEYVDGISLKDYILRNGKVPLNQALSWISEIANILNYLHKMKPAIIFRDLKPSNIMIQKNGEIKLIDLGAVYENKYLGDSKVDNYGTCGYSDPLLWQGEAPSPASDIYSLAVILYEMLTGIGPLKPPYQLKQLRQIDRTIPKSVEKAVVEAISSPKERHFLCVEDFVTALNAPLKEERRNKVMFSIKKGIVFFSYLVALLGIIVPVTTKGISNINALDWLYEGLIVLAAYLLNQSLIIKTSSVGNQIKIQKEIWLSDKKYAGLFGVFIACGIMPILISLSWVGNMQASSETLPKELWMDLKDSSERKILLKKDSVYETDDVIRLEIPKSAIEGSQVALQVTATDTLGNRYVSRKFMLKGN